ncbi:LOW QUALITY PROTEIN: ATP synthase mitochondrial F1 complex assembly factor 1-like [Dermacentor silvarum]|uniref:LOW QUALITY PROTEIN: ATP synthase mitochondrial F1 complex assembly factor 1-like n=1 Tax=Dermacentor silvarum TaxID=543639 RepID=UPI0018994932|nr:LOW QUALITY PROTEIN: ATP synthase mitochondrial F1 complex assembly factor 1-like [Dermacentor silvarum]
MFSFLLVAMAFFRPAWRFMLQRLSGGVSNRSGRELTSAVQATILARPLSSESDRQAAAYSRNPFYSKYADKIRELERRDPDALKRRQEEVSRRKNTTNASSSTEEAVPSRNGSDDVVAREDSRATNRNEKVLQPEPSYVRPSKFDADTIRELRSRCETVSDLTDAWKRLHGDRDAVCAVIPASVYEMIRERAKDYPVFLYPLPRKAGGYEFVLSQFLGDRCHMTPLASYQRHGSEAPACLALSYWTQLASREDGAVVLMSGEYDSKVIGPTEAQCLVNQLQLYYGGNELKKKLLLWNFNREARSFNYEALIREFEASATREDSSVRQS